MIGTCVWALHEWRWMLGVTALPALFFLLMLFGIPRSPRWLVKKGPCGEAREMLGNWRNENFEVELQEIVNIDSTCRAWPRAGVFVLSASTACPIFLAVSIGMFNQLSGINAILYYLNDIFAAGRI